MAQQPSDLTRTPDLREEAAVGPRRHRRPLYRDHLPPCNAACPAGENIQAWLAEARAGRYQAAWERLVETNPLPAVCGRICYQPCEGRCNRGELDSAVSIHAVERFLGDRALAAGWPYRLPAARPGEPVMVVGAGPSGLAAAYHLRRLGHRPTIVEAGPMAGGMMHFGIPAYRLPRDVLEAEVERIEALGVEIVLDRRVDNVRDAMQAGGFRAAFLAIGAHLSQRVEIPARDAGRILDAVSFLRDVETGSAPKLGRRVAVYGGGNTAMDAARTAKRLGADEAMIVYRRDREHMPAHDFEADEALSEGVKINWLRTIRAIEGDTFTVEEMEIDDEGRPRPTGRTETLEADALILALGQNVDSALLEGVPGIEIGADGAVRVDRRMMTGCPGIFAGGDMVPSERTATAAIGHGKEAARQIDAWLRGGEYHKPPSGPRVSFADMHVWFYSDALRQRQSELPAAERRRGFAEVVAGLGAPEARFEAARCLACGNCFECDGCYGACPEEAIVKLGIGRGYRVELDRCTGCAICAEQCPCHAIDMIPEAT